MPLVELNGERATYRVNPFPSASAHLAVCVQVAQFNGTDQNVGDNPLTWKPEKNLTNEELDRVFTGDDPDQEPSTPPLVNRSGDDNRLTKAQIARMTSIGRRRR